MKVAVVGSRGFGDRALLFSTLDALQVERGAFSLIVSGGARGADSLAEEYARDRDIGALVVEPDWDRYGRAAGPRRNVEIVKSAELVVAFWDGESRGTKNTIDLARKAGREVVVVHTNTP